MQVGPFSTSKRVNERDLQLMQHVFDLREKCTVFSSSRSILNQSEFITLKPQTPLDPLVIDIFAEILTDIERKKNTLPLNWYLPMAFSNAALNGDAFSFVDFVKRQNIRENYMSDLKFCAKMFIPIHAQKKSRGHFYLCIVHLKDQEIEVWDSQSDHFINKRERDKTIQKLLLVLNILANDTWRTGWMFTKFSWRIANNIPHRHGYESGIFVIKYMQQSADYMTRNPWFQSDEERLDLALTLLKSELNKERERLYEKTVERHYAQARMANIPKPLQSSHLSEAANSIPVTTNFGQWQKEKRIGGGRFGTVYVARNSETGELCAVKEMFDIGDPQTAKSLNKEMQILSLLKHPNVVQYYDSEIVGSQISLYMEYVQPGSLMKYMLERGAFQELEVSHITAQILLGLAYLHSKRIVHRDIKADNLLVDSHNNVKLTDFGLAKQLDSSQGHHSEKTSIYWTAPEILSNDNYNCRDEATAPDIWSLGCVIIELLTGKRPWHGLEWGNVINTVCNKNKDPPMPENLSTECQQFLKLCFTRNPEMRPSAEALLNHPFVNKQAGRKHNDGKEILKEEQERTRNADRWRLSCVKFRNGCCMRYFGS